MAPFQQASPAPPRATPRRSLLDALKDPARLAILSAIGLPDGTPDATLQRLTRLASRALSVPRAHVALVGEARVFVCAETEPAGPMAVTREIPVTDSFCQHVVEGRVALVVRDAREHPFLRDYPAISEKRVVAFLAVPLVTDGHVIGSLCAVAEEPRDWTDRDVALMTDLGEAASEALTLRVRRADELIVDAMERSVLASLPDTGVIQLDRDLRVTMAAGLGFRQAGWAPHTFAGRDLSKVLGADGFAELAPRCDAVLAGGSVSFDTAGPAGSVWWVQAAPVRDASGSVRGVSLVLRDVTESRARERILAEREALYRLLADNSSDVISRHDPDGRFLYASPAAETVFGCPPAALAGRLLCDLAEPDDRTAVQRYVITLGVWDAPVTFDFRVRGGDGRVRWMECTATAIRGGAGAARELHCATRDITVRRTAEDARRASEAYSRTLLSALPEAVAIHDADNRVVSMNPSAERMLGTRSELSAPDAGWSVSDEHGRPLPEEDRPPARVLATGQPQLGVTVAFDHPVRGRKWLRLNAVPLHGAGGSIEHVLISWADVTELREAKDRARHQADHDPLTGLPNRALLRRHLGESLAAASADGRDLAVLFLDLDGFKIVNDSLGHHAGDALLLAVADLLAGELRGSADTLARFAGDEFVVVAPRVEGSAGAAALARRLLEVLRRPLQVAGAEHVVHASIGIAIAPGGDGEVEQLLRDADIAMYQAKTDGGRVSRVFAPEMGRNAAQRLSTESALRQAIANDELELHYQPIWHLRDRRLAGFEALVRWRHPERGLIPPGEFIPVAEQSLLIVDIGEWVLRSACRQLRDWQASHGIGSASVNVNIAARQVADPTFPARLAALLAEHQLPASCLGLEVTESMLMKQHGHGLQTLTELHDLGVKLSLDDFGTGYSSLSHLKDLPLDVLKIDRSFVSAPDGGRRQETILGAIVTMAHSLDLKVVAEGVETEAQLAMLRGFGCDLAQGFLLARPAPAAAVTSLLPNSGEVSAYARAATGAHSALGAGDSIDE